jgi:hypothetical protein
LAQVTDDCPEHRDRPAAGRRESRRLQPQNRSRTTRLALCIENLKRAATIRRVECSQLR